MRTTTRCLIKPAPMKRSQKNIMLHQLVDQVTQNLMPRIVEQKSLMVNDLHKEMLVTTNEEILTTVLRNLLNTIVTHSQNNCIRISAKIFGNIVLLHVKDSDNRHEEAIAGSLIQVAPLAEKIGGCITLNNYTAKGTTVAFSFYNNEQKAYIS